MTDTGLQGVVSRNIRVLMAVRGVETQKDLATRLGWIETKLTKSFRGDRKWSLEDLPLLAKAFDVTPGLLLGEVPDLVGALGPARTGTDGVSGPVSALYGSTNRGASIPLTLVPALVPRYDHEERMADLLAMPAAQWENRARAPRDGGHLVAVATG